MVAEEAEVDVEIKSPAHKFHMFVRTSQNVSKAATPYIQGCNLLEGDWEKVGSIVLWKLLLDGEARVSKDRMEAMDLKNFVIQWRVLEGPLKKEYKSFLKTMKVTPKKIGSRSVVKWNFKYERINEKVGHPEKLIDTAQVPLLVCFIVPNNVILSGLLPLQGPSSSPK